MAVPHERVRSQVPSLASEIRDGLTDLNGNGMRITAGSCCRTASLDLMGGRPREGSTFRGHVRRRQVGSTTTHGICAGRGDSEWPTSTVRPGSTTLSDRKAGVSRADSGAFRMIVVTGAVGSVGGLELISRSVTLCVICRRVDAVSRAVRRRIWAVGGMVAGALLGRFGAWASQLAHGGFRWLIASAVATDSGWDQDATTERWRVTLKLALKLKVFTFSEV